VTILALAVLLGLVGVAALVAANLRIFRPAPPALPDPPPVSILIPARDEAAGIEAAARAACAQTTPEGEVVVLDDGSTDGTAEILARLAAELPRLRVVAGAALPPGWAGKAWACWQLASRHARHDWLLFVDADVRLAPAAAARALAAARAQDAVFVSAFPRQETKTAGEALLVPLVYLVLLAYLPMALIRRHPMPSLSAACGQFMLVERAAYLAAGGHQAVPATLHDGLKLARRMKAAGFPVGLFDGGDIATCRMYAGFRATWRGFARNAYEALGSPAALATMVVLNGAFFVLPFVALPVVILTGAGAVATASWGAAAALALGIRTALAVRFGVPAWTVLATPVAVASMIGIQLHSSVRHATGRPVVWRARAYSSAVRGKG
jgi:Glycosyl transferase family 2